MAPAPSPLITLQELAIRWGVSARTASQIARAKGLPFIYLGRGEYDPAAGGRKKLIRFRLAAVEVFEARQERAERPRQVPAAVTGAGAIPGWDGKNRMRRPRTR